MRRRLGRLAALGFALLLGAAGACTAFSGEPAASSPADAGTADAASAQDVTAGEDAAVPLALDDGGCTAIATPDAFAPPHAGSQLSGYANLTDNAGLVTLTDVNQNTIGTLWYPIPALSAAPTSFDISFDLGAASPQGDGVAIIGSSNDPGSVPSAGANSGSLGFCPSAGTIGPTGAAIGLEFFQHLLFVESSDGGVCQGSNSVTAAYDAPPPLGISAKISGVNVLAAVTKNAGTSTTTVAATLAAAVPIRWVGIAGANGGAAGVATIGNVSLRVCP